MKDPPSLDEWRQLLESTLAEPIQALEDAISNGSPHHLMGALAFGGNDEQWKTAAVRRLLDSPTLPAELRGELLVFLASHWNAIPEATRSEVQGRIANADQQSKLPAIASSTAQHLLNLITRRRFPPVETRHLQRWLHAHDPTSALLAARELLRLAPAEFTADIESAAYVAGLSREEDDHELLLTKALEASAADNLDVAFRLCTYVGRCARHDEAIATVFSRAAATGFAVGNLLERFAAALSESRVCAIISDLNPDALPWFADQYVPHMVRQRRMGTLGLIKDATLAPPVADAIARADWERNEDLVQLCKNARLSTSLVRLQALENLARRLHTDDLEDRFRRSGLDTLTSAVLDSEVDYTETEFTGAFQACDHDMLAEIWAQARWSRPERAETMGRLAMHHGEALVKKLAMAGQASRSERAQRAFIEGAIAHNASAECFAALMDDYVGSLEIGSVLAKGAPEATKRLEQRWQTGFDIEAFRILDAIHLDSRLETAAKAVRDFALPLSDEERSELLEALSGAGQLHGALLDVLESRHQDVGERPSNKLLIHALSKVREEVAANWLEYSQVEETLENICREHTDRAVRIAAYAVIGQSWPTPRSVGFLKEREQSDSQATRAAISEALGHVADALEDTILSSATSVPNKMRATELLADIRPLEAASYAHSFLQADAASERARAATLIGQHGTRDDADKLSAAFEDEPDPQVRDAASRAIRLLKVGNVVAAHERLGEMLALGDQIIADTDPRSLYDQWSDAIVSVLNRIDAARDSGDYGTAIDQLGGELAKILLFRAIEVAGDEGPVQQNRRQQMANNVGDYGSVVKEQRIVTAWPYVTHLAALYEMRTEHIADRGRTSPVVEADHSDYDTALRLFRMGGAEVWRTIQRSTG